MGHDDSLLHPLRYLPPLSPSEQQKFRRPRGSENLVKRQREGIEDTIGAFQIRRRTLETVRQHQLPEVDLHTLMQIFQNSKVEENGKNLV